MKNLIRRIRLGSPFFILAGLIFTTACNDATHEPKPAANATFTDLNTITTELPNAAGYEAFKMNCTNCHSARYVQMQPDFPEKTWTAIVTKMQKSFGAPLTDSAANEIVKYLVTIKGKT